MLTENKNLYVFGSLQATSTISTEFLGTDIPGLLLPLSLFSSPLMVMTRTGIQ